MTVATSDGLEQVIILGQGARRLSARGLREEIEAASIEIRGDYLNRQGPTKNLLIHQLPGEMAELMEDVRLAGVPWRTERKRGVNNLRRDE